MGWFSFTTLLSGICLAYVAHSIWTIFNIYHIPQCDDTASQCLHPWLFKKAKDGRYINQDVSVSVVWNEIPARWLITYVIFENYTMKSLLLVLLCCMHVQWTALNRNPIWFPLPVWIFVLWICTSVLPKFGSSGHCNYWYLNICICSELYVNHFFQILDQTAFRSISAAIWSQQYAALRELLEQFCFAFLFISLLCSSESLSLNIDGTTLLLQNNTYTWLDIGLLWYTYPTGNSRCCCLLSIFTG